MKSGQCDWVGLCWRDVAGLPSRRGGWPMPAGGRRGLGGVEGPGTLRVKACQPPSMRSTTNPTQSWPETPKGRRRHPPQSHPRPLRPTPPRQRRHLRQLPGQQGRYLDYPRPPHKAGQSPPASSRAPAATSSKTAWTSPAPAGELPGAEAILKLRAFHCNRDFPNTGATTSTKNDNESTSRATPIPSSRRRPDAPSIEPHPIQILGLSQTTAEHEVPITWTDHSDEPSVRARPCSARPRSAAAGSSTSR